MELIRNDLSALFAQLGLPSSPAEIQRFVAQHRPVADDQALSEAPFWSASQAGFLREKLQEDADWAPAVDTLNALLRG